jgi:hypothetical protein
MSEVPVGLERVKAFLGGEWTCVDKGHRTSSAPEPAPTDVQAHSCFSAFLEANEDEEEEDVVPDHPTVTVGNGASAPVEHGFAFAVQTMANAVGASSVDVDVSGVDDILRAHGSEGLETRYPTGCAIFPPVVGIAGLLLSVTSSTPLAPEAQDGAAVEHPRPEGGSLLWQDQLGVDVVGSVKRGRP